MKASDAASEALREQVRTWYTGTIGTRLNNKRDGVIISIQQRLHEDDLSATMIEQGAFHLNLPAIATNQQRVAIAPDRFQMRMPGDLLNPEGEDSEVLEQLRRDNGVGVFNTKWQQDPTPPEGDRVRLEWFPRYEEAPERDQLLKVVQSWDTAMTADPNSAFSVCTTWGYHERRWYLLDRTQEGCTATSND